MLYLQGKVEKIPLSTINYPIRKKLKRIPLDVAKEKYDQIKSAAETTGESVNGYIKKAIDMRMESDNINFQNNTSNLKESGNIYTPDFK